MKKSSPGKSSLPLVVYGAGGHGKVILDIARQLGYRVALVLDDDASQQELTGVPIMLAQHVDWTCWKSFCFIVAIGDNSVRQRIFEQMVARGGLPQTLIHPFTSVSRSAQIGRANSICAGAVVNPDSIIGENCIINTSASVDHDCFIGAHSHVCPGAHLAGNVRIGAKTMIGTGASVLPGIQIGEGCRVGAGAVVNRDLPPSVVAIGVPARVQVRRSA
jgi:sugar O-acyltransferase (sialic acid O-acetyltransferase NeuD family)